MVLHNEVSPSGTKLFTVFVLVHLASMGLACRIGWDSNLHDLKPRLLMAPMGNWPVNPYHAVGADRELWRSAPCLEEQGFPLYSPF